MLFNSHIFIFAFLPIAFIGYWLIGRRSTPAAMLWLTLASLVFYGWWNPSYLPLILLSIFFNYFVGAFVANADRYGFKARYRVLLLGITSNLLLLGYYKYANFMVDNVNQVFGSDWTLRTIILPLAISFFTFQQISYLVDAFRTRTHESSFLRFALFVTFFPQLIAGPIVHHREMLPQFSEALQKGLRYQNLAMGLSCFFIGLFKKAVIADGIALYASPVFNHVAAGGEVGFIDAWQGGLCYTFQMYFDFSGYSDMALGLALLFGIRLPLNFASPLKSASMIEFWRRWHMTLGRFLQAYLFQPLSLIELRKRWWSQPYLAFIATMTLGGLWHGASWTFVIWGLMHGVLLAVNQGWRVLKKRWGWPEDSLFQRVFISHPLTFLSIVFTLTVFRADNIEVAGHMLSAMVGLQGLALNSAWIDWPMVETFAGLGIALDPEAGQFFAPRVVAWIVGCCMIVWLLPNTYQLFDKEAVAVETYRLEPRRGLAKYILWRPSFHWMIAVAVLAIFGIDALNNVTEFLYFQF